MIGFLFVDSPFMHYNSKGEELPGIKELRIFYGSGSFRVANSDKEL